MLKIIIFALVATLTNQTQADASDFAMRHPLLTGGVVFVTGAVVAETIRRECLNPDGSTKERCRSANEAEPNNLGKPGDLGILKSAHTAELRRNLNRDQISAGMPPDPDDCDAHHIVPKKEGRKWAKELADSARAILDACSIDIDSEQNGIYLPAKDDGSSKCRGSYHKTLHKKTYYTDIEKRLSDAAEVDCQAVADELSAIKNNLFLGKF